MRAEVLQISDGGRDIQWVPAEGRVKAEAELERLGDFLGHDGGAKRAEAASDSLRETHDVRPEPIVLAGEHLPRPAESGRHLIGDEERPVLPAGPLHDIEVLPRRDDDREVADDEFGNVRGNVPLAQYLFHLPRGSGIERR